MAVMQEFSGRPVISGEQIEAAAEMGRSELVIPAGALITPLAHERAAALGISLSSSVAPDRHAGHAARRAATQAKAREIVARVVADRGGDPSMVDDMVKTVMERMSSSCKCGDHR